MISFHKCVNFVDPNRLDGLFLQFFKLSLPFFRFVFKLNYFFFGERPDWQVQQKVERLILRFEIFRLENFNCALLVFAMLHYKASVVHHSNESTFLLKQLNFVFEFLNLVLSSLNIYLKSNFIEFLNDFSWVIVLLNLVSFIKKHHIGQIQILWQPELFDQSTISFIMVELNNFLTYFEIKQKFYSDNSTHTM